jgi:hypothetical protein
MPIFLKATHSLRNEKRKKRQRKGKKSDKKTKQEHCFLNLYVTWGKNTDNHIFLKSQNFFFITPNRVQKSNCGKISDILSLCLYFPPLQPYYNRFTFKDGVGKILQEWK